MVIWDYSHPKEYKSKQNGPSYGTFNAQTICFSQTFCTFAREYSSKYVFIMARPIKETPILYGEDARRFEARMKQRRRISAEERARINAAYEAVKSVCDFM